VVLEQQLRRRRVDPQHRRLLQIEPGGQRDRVAGGDAAPLRPVLALHVDHEVADPRRRDAGADRGDAADALRSRCRRQRRTQPVGTAAERQIGRVDRKGEHVEHDFARSGGADIGRVDAMRDRFRRAVIGDLDLLHRHPPSSPRRV